MEPCPPLAEPSPELVLACAQAADHDPGVRQLALVDTLMRVDYSGDDHAAGAGCRKSSHHFVHVGGFHVVTAAVPFGLGEADPELVDVHITDLDPGIRQAREDLPANRGLTAAGWPGQPQQRCPVRDQCAAPFITTLSLART